MARLFQVDVGGAAANNFGYLHLVVGELDEARRLFDLAIKTGNSQSTIALSYFNRATLEGKVGDFASARQDLLHCRSILSVLATEERRVGCVIVPLIEDSELSYRETRGVEDLLPLCDSSIEILRVMESQSVAGSGAILDI